MKYLVSATYIELVTNRYAIKGMTVSTAKTLVHNDPDYKKGYAGLQELAAQGMTEATDLLKKLNANELLGQ